MNLIRFDFATLPVSPWRNGGGETREIISQPLGDEEFSWRASIATIAQNGPFSVFNGIDRSITLLEGDGVHLFSEGQIDHCLQEIGKPFAFPGDVPVKAALLGGSSQDFNIMTRRGYYSAHVQRVVETFGLSLLHAGVFYVLQGEWQLPNGSLLVARQGCWWQPGSGPLRLVVKGNNAIALWADIVPVKAA
ncbi:HutD family protein [Serratia sp. UGAL515B_01]|uniref:HutD/Ves family protein n=1 Tax=Serratia sp. UGAL515B_01 TaxID=2986763 RepID=UPI002952A27B|nr:HutD family protein [Serratia sp. UGAL515B_01]WON78807.1 HutD family protein [Serratia sp. UGAL515B_01]